MDNFGNLSDEELMGLARQAGYLPEDRGVATDTPEDTGQNPESPVSSPSTPSVGSGYSTPVPAPGQGNLAGPVKSHSQSSSSRGFDSGAYTNIEASTGQGLQGDMARASTTAYQVDRPAIQATRNAAQSKVDAQDAQTQANVDAIHQEGTDALVMQKLNDDFAVEEQKINAQATALSNKSKADYLAALTDFRASRVDPSQLWHNMTGGERFGTMMAAFAHDFLGARGINTSAMGTLNKAIDRNIDAQVQAIKTKGEVAEGFKSLWYMQRNQSASDTEARARVRGFLLDGAKQAVIANMAQYKSALASAQGKAAVAQINEEFAKNLVDIYKHMDSNAVALRQQAIDIWKEKVNAAIQSRSVAVSESAEARAAAKDKKSVIETLNDPETGKPTWAFRPGLQDTEKEKVRDRLEAADEVNHQINELRELTRSSKSSMDLTGNTRFEGTADQKFDAIATRLAHSMAKANGERATNEDVIDFKQGLRKKTWGNQADAEQVLADTQKQALYSAHAALKNRVIDLPGEMQDMFPGNPTQRPFAGSAIDAENTANPPKPTTDQLHLQNATKLSGGAGQDNLDPESYTGDVKREHEELFRQRPDLFGHKVDGVGTGAGAEPGPGEYVPNDPKGFEKSVMEYVRLAQSPEPSVRKQAREALKDLAGGLTNNSDDPEAFAAAWALSELPAETEK